MYNEQRVLKASWDEIVSGPSCTDASPDDRIFSSRMPSDRMPGTGNGRWTMTLTFKCCMLIRCRAGAVKVAAQNDFGDRIRAVMRRPRPTDSPPILRQHDIRQHLRHPGHSYRISFRRFPDSDRHRHDNHQQWARHIDRHRVRAETMGELGSARWSEQCSIRWRTPTSAGHPS